MTPIFFLPGLWVSALFIAVALADLAGRSRPLLAAASVLLLLTPFARLAVAEPPGPFARAGTLRGLWLAAPARWDPFLHDPLWDAYGRNAMGALAPRAVVLSCWEAATTLRYFRHAEPLRDDVDVLYHCLLPRPALAAADSAGRPVYTTYPLTREMTGGRAFHEVARWTRGGLWRIAAPGSGSPPR